MVLGHESSGIVIKVGKQVSHLKEGDRVALEPGVPCGHCEHCKHGKYNLCPDIQFLATPPVHGSLARYHIHAADFCYKLPDNVSCEEGALCEPLSVGIHACRRANVFLGCTVLVCGAGPIGLVCMLTAKAMGASQVVITDISEHRLGVAKEMGATHTVLIDSKDTAKISDKIQTALGGNPDRSIECSGAEPSIDLAISSTKSGGCVVLVGMGNPNVTIPVFNLLAREVDVRGIFRYSNTYPTAINMIASGAVNVKPLITHRFKLEETLDAFETARTGAGGAIKCMISCEK